MSEFTNAQMYRINLGKSIGLPYQVYADPGMSAERMNTILSALIKGMDTNAIQTLRDPNISDGEAWNRFFLLSLKREQQTGKTAEAIFN